MACRADGKRSSLFVGYLRTPTVGGYGFDTAWLTEFDLGRGPGFTRTFAMAPGPIGDMAYDALTDRLYAVGRYSGQTAPLFILDLPPCAPPDPADATAVAACPAPRYQLVELIGALNGAELIGIALSNPQPGRPRRAYLSVRIYDQGYAAAVGGRPGFDIGGAIMVLDLVDDWLGNASARVANVVPIGPGAGLSGASRSDPAWRPGGGAERRGRLGPGVRRRGRRGGAYRHGSTRPPAPPRRVTCPPPWPSRTGAPRRWSTWRRSATGP